MLDRSEEALLTLYQRYGTLVYSVALRVLQNQQDAEEVTQDVFMRVWEKADAYDPNRGALTSWLAVMTRHAAIDYLRKQQRRLPEPIVSLDEHPQLWETLDIDEPDIELTRQLASAISHLSTEHQEALVLAYMHGLSQREIADHLNRPLGTVKSHLKQALDRLRRLWLSQET